MSEENIKRNLKEIKKMMIQNKNYQIFLNFNQMRLFKFFLRREKN